MTNYIAYEFNTDTVSYPLGYDSSKLNLGHLMQKNTDENGDNYVSPIEPKFLRGLEILRVTPFSYVVQVNSLGSLKYNDDTIWLFYAGGGSQGTIAKRIFLATYKKSINEIQDIGSIQVNYTPNNLHNAYSVTPSMEKHTGGTITVIGNSVTGSSTTWLTDGVCVGNRIGFGSSNSDDITTWYEVLVVNSDTSITLTKGLYTDGDPNVLNITGATQYVIEDFRIIYANYGSSSVTVRGISLVKGLRYELFQVLPTTIPAGTTVDNIRACYRLLDTSTTSATFSPIGSVLEEKTSFTQQDYYVLSYPATTSISIQKFNIRASLTLTLGRSDSAFVFTTGNQLHNGTNTLGYNPMMSDFNGNYYVTHSTRVSRIPTSGITNGSTTFIADAMIENPPGTSTTFPLSSSLVGGHYLRQIDKFYVGHTQGTIRNYITSYVVGGQFDKTIHINDQTQQSTYLIDKFNYLTNNFLSSTIYSHYNDGISFLVRDIVSNNNIIYVLPLEADKDYHTLSNSCVITPEITTLSATSYNKVYLNLDNFFNTNQRFYIPRENCDIYYRTSGITSDTGSWTLVSENGEISGSSSSIQFKLTFRTIGLYSIPNRIKGIVLSYDSPIPLSIPFYEPSLKFTDKSSQIFSWRQDSLFNQTIPNLNIDIYDSSNNLLLSDSVSGSTSGIWQYSNDNGLNWNSWSSTANTIDNYIRYSSSTLSASGLIIKPILYI